MSRPAGRPNITYRYKNKLCTLQDLIKISGLNENTLKRRIYVQNMDIEQAVEMPLVKQYGKLYKLNEKDYTFAQLLKLWPYSESALKNRIFTQSMTAQEAFDLPLYGRKKS